MRASKIIYIAHNLRVVEPSSKKNESDEDSDFETETLQSDVLDVDESEFTNLEYVIDDLLKAFAKD